MEKKPLKFKDGKFKILLLGDLHEKYDTTNEIDRLKTEDCLTLLNKSADELKPDLAIFLGDNASGDNAEEFRQCVARIMKPFADRSIPVAVIFGNHDHDHENVVDLKTQMSFYNEFDNCYMFNADDSITGYGNYYLKLKASNSDKDIYNLWFIDSNNLCEDRDISYYDWVREDQIEWYKKTALKFAEENGGEPLPALLFQHATVPEEYELLREAKPYEYLDSVQGNGIWTDKRYVLRDDVEGYIGEPPCPPCVNSGEFAAWKEIGDIRGAFFGHDHMNDFVGYLDSIMLAQSKTAGFRVYTDGCRSGVRLITLKEDNLDDIDTRMYYFKKDFKLKSKSIGFYMRHVTDRQDLKLKVASAVLGSVVGISTVAGVTYKLVKKYKKN